MMKKKTTWALLALLPVISLSGTAWGGSKDLSVDMFAMDLDDVRLDGVYTCRYCISASSDAWGGCLAELEESCKFVEGVYQASIDISSLSAATLPGTTYLWIEIDDEQLEPVELDAVPYSLVADVANEALSVATSAVGTGLQNVGGAITIDTTKVPQLSSANTFSGANAFSGANTFSATNTFSASQAFSSGLNVTSGNVGIGTSSPATGFHVTSQSTTTPTVRIEKKKDQTSNLFEIRRDTGHTDLHFTSTGSLVMENAPFVVTNVGRVGIKVASPVNPLDVEGAAVIGASYSGTSTAPTNGLLVEGEVGIATASPAAGLHVLAPDATKPTLRLEQKSGQTSDYFQIRRSSGQTDFKINSLGGLVMENAPFTVTHVGNVGVGTTSFGTSAGYVLAIGNGTAPTTSITDGVQLYAEDVAASSELRVRDEAGNVTTLSPHNYSLFTPDPSYELPWSFYSRNDKVGKEINVDMYGAIKAIEEMSGKQFIYVRGLEGGPVEKTASASAAPENAPSLSTLLKKKLLAMVRGWLESNDSRPAIQEGVPIKEQATGEVYCLGIKEGTLHSSKGPCQ